jgi:hypothetical protein
MLRSWWLGMLNHVCITYDLNNILDVNYMSMLEESVHLYSYFLPAFRFKWPIKKQD